MRLLKVLAITLLIFASLETIAAVISSEYSCSFASVCLHNNSGGGLLALFLGYSTLASVISWLILAPVAIFWRTGAAAHKWNNAGFSKNIYDLMIKMRGSSSRLVLLQSLSSPRHRTELSELSGLDWKEVDRNLELLQSYGLVSVFVQTGSVKVYQITEQGRLLLRLVEDLGRHK